MAAPAGKRISYCGFSASAFGLGKTQSALTFSDRLGRDYRDKNSNPARKAAEEAAAKIAKAMQSPPKRGKVVAFQKAQG